LQIIDNITADLGVEYSLDVVRIAHFSPLTIVYTYQSDSTPAQSLSSMSFLASVAGVLSSCIRFSCG
jgi:hypothetical protein